MSGKVREFDHDWRIGHPGLAAGNLKQNTDAQFATFCFILYLVKLA